MYLHAVGLALSYEVFASIGLVQNPRMCMDKLGMRDRGQGCPLSPYLFVLCMDTLGQWLQSRIAEGRLREVRASRNGPGLNYLFFADDLLLLSDACEDQLSCIKEGLDCFCSCSSQRINFQKSSMFFSSNVSKEDAHRLSSLMGIPLTKK